MHGLVLQVALAALVADGAVQRVVDLQRSSHTSVVRGWFRGGSGLGARFNISIGIVVRLTGYAAECDKLLMVHRLNVMKLRLACPIVRLALCRLP